MPGSKTLIVCDLQPDVVPKISTNSRLWVDLVALAIQAARCRSTNDNIMRIWYTQLYFEREELTKCIPTTHRRLGILKKLAATVQWFTSKELCVAPRTDHAEERVFRRTTFLPQSQDKESMETLKQYHQSTSEYILVGYGPTVQAMCHILGDVLGAPCIRLVRELIQDENPERCRAFLNHGLLFQEEVISMVDYLESLDLLHTRIPPIDPPITQPPNVKYVCDVGRGGHLSLFLHYLKQQYGYVEWPVQPWYQEDNLIEVKQYYCPLGRQIVDLCDENQFGNGTRLFLLGRKYLDEKDLLYSLVPDMMPPTFETIEKAKEYNEETVWFLKKVNQNGGRAVDVLRTEDLPSKLEPDDQLQCHIPRPLLWENGIKCHVKTYQWIGCVQIKDKVEWQLHQHDLFYLATASKPWNPQETSDEAQITTMRTHRLYRDHPWRKQWNLTDLCQSHMCTVLRRAIEQEKLQVELNQTTIEGKKTLQFEIHSADWMLDESGRIYLIECNGIPVLYDPGQKQPLWTKGLQLYDRLYKENPEGAVVNDHDLMKEAVQLAVKGDLPEDSLWTHLMSVPVAGDAKK